MKDLSPSEITKQIKNLFLNEGFVHTGISKTGELKQEKEFYRKWLDEKRNAGMDWIEKSFEKRVNPSLINKDFLSVISAAYIYDTPFENSDDAGTAKISRYAWGSLDYHKILKKKLKKICREIESLTDGITTKYYVDDGPVMEKVWAVKSGIGWMGKNTTVINPETGSFFFLCVVFTNIELEYDKPIEDLCETCRICLNACPTGALYEPYKLDANLCISYHTIENKGDIPEYIDLNGWVFGCDICQDVCPYNRHKLFTEDKSFNPLEQIFNKTSGELSKITEDEFNELFKSSSIKRTGYNRWRRNLNKCRM